MFECMFVGKMGEEEGEEPAGLSKTFNRVIHPPAQPNNISISLLVRLSRELVGAELVRQRFRVINIEVQSLKGRRLEL